MRNEVRKVMKTETKHVQIYPKIDQNSKKSIKTTLKN